MHIDMLDDWPETEFIPLAAVEKDDGQALLALGSENDCRKPHNSRSFSAFGLNYARKS